MSEEHVVTRTMDDVRDMAKARRHAPSWQDVKKMAPGGRERVESDPVSGRQERSYRVRIREDNGTLTKAGRELLGSMKPFMRAEAERGLKLSARQSGHVGLRDLDGARRYVAPHLADQAARRNGWHHDWKKLGNVVERGMDGMLFRYVSGQWFPLGVRCLGTPLEGVREVAKEGIQHDPDGQPWRWVRDEWVTL